MNKKTVLLIGDLPLASLVLRKLLENDAVSVVGVITSFKSVEFRNDPWQEIPCLFNEAKSNKVKVFNSTYDVLDNFGCKSIDIGISCRSSIIFKKQFIDIFNDFFINMHGGLLPQRAGLYIANHAILNNDKTSGGTIHEINEKIDKGDIYAIKKFKILDHYTALDVYKNTQLCLYDLFISILSKLIDGSIANEKLKQDFKKRKYFDKRSLADKKEIFLNKRSISDIYRIVRGLDFPGHEPAYINFKGKKIYLTTQKFFKDE